MDPDRSLTPPPLLGSHGFWMPINIPFSIAGSLLRPYISPKNYWILTHHEIFQAYYYGDAMNIDKNTRDRFKDQPYYGACEEFCGRWDETAFDPDYESLPLTEFEPMLVKILSRTPYIQPGLLNDQLNGAKAALNCYDFDQWLNHNEVKV